MLNVESIQNGIVIDHIPAGKGMDIYRLLELESKTQSVALLQSVKSQKYGCKDLIKIEGETLPERLDILGYLDSQITLIVIRDGKVAKKYHPVPPQRLVNVIKCKNPRCITSVEQEIDHVFKLPAFQILLSYERQFRFRPLATPLAAYAFLLEQIFGCFRSEYRRPNAG